VKTPRILVACVGNIFLGDDGFGVEVAAVLARSPMPEGVILRDFGIRSYDLGYAIADGHDVIVFVDATRRGQEPGTLSLIELDPPSPTDVGDAGADAHSLDPASVLRMSASLGARLGLLYLVGCEPATLECEDGQIGLSGPVSAAVAGAAEMVRSLVAEILSIESNETHGSSGPAHNKGLSNECVGNRRNRDRDIGALLRRKNDTGAHPLPAHA
jgi:hydrogenase maturation protease